MATIYDYLIGAGGDQTLGQEQTADSPLPEYLRDASARAIEAAKGIASEGYTAYSGPRVAGLSQDQLDAIAQQQSYAGQGVAGAGQKYMGDIKKRKARAKKRASSNDD